MKLHRPLVESVCEALDDIFEKGYYADKVIERHLKFQRKWGARDRKYFAETVYDIVRWYRLLIELAESDDFFDIWRAYTLKRGQTLPDWAESDRMSLESIADRMQELTGLPLRASVPDWLYRRGQAEIGESWDSLIQALNQPAPVYLRVNTLKGSREDLQNLLRTEEIETQFTSDPDGLVLLERKSVFRTEAFKKGLFEVQDSSSQKVAPLLAVQPGHRVVDACAGAGGKALHLAALMKNKGKIIAMDIHEWKLKELKTRAARGGVDIIETRAIENTKTVKRLEGSFDRVLLDVPCSGLGVLRRNPDTKWKLTVEELERLNGLQAQIIKDYASMAKVGGRMVYATCSILPSENEKQVQKFLAQNPNWKLVEEMSIRPDQGGSDGFYGAALVRES